jgi:protein-serine/threonine kinase
MNNAAIVEADNYISMPAATGAGLKARRFSTNLPADFDVETVELHDEYTSGSIVPGRRGKLVGKGSTATVKLMIQKGASTDGVFAVKEFRKKGQHETEDEYNKKVNSEYMIAKSLHHPNIVESIRLCTHAGRWNHVMEFCSQGEIYTLVQKNYLTLEDNLCLFKQLLRGVAYLHSNGIAHRDIKLENLLMNNEGHLKITDFGVSAVFCGEHPGTRKAQTLSDEDANECRLCAPGICGSLPYIAPEVIDKSGKVSSSLSSESGLTSLSGHYDPRPLDVWSCAIVLLSMIYKGNPWPAANRTHPHHHYARFLSGWDKFIDKYPDGLITGSETPSCGPLFASLHKPAIRNLLLRMMHPNPNKRITVHEAVRDRSVQGIECCCLEEYGGGVVIDAKDKESWKVVGRVGVRKVHNHLPPKESRLPGGILHKLDLGSR